MSTAQNTYCSTVETANQTLAAARSAAEMARQQSLAQAARRDEHGFIEQGIGAGANKNKNHFDAMRQAEKLGDLEPGTTDRAVADFCRDYPAQAKKIGLVAPRASK
jgi:hypothetical protein